MMNRTFRTVVVLASLLLLAPRLSLSQTPQTSNLAPGAPGHDATWESAGKSAVGTSTTTESKVWFTLREGVLTEVYYPTVDAANTRLLQLVVVSGDGTRVDTEEEMTHSSGPAHPQALVFTQYNEAKDKAYRIQKTYVTDPERHTVLISVRFFAERPAAWRLYVYHDPSLNNSGMHDSAWTQEGALLSADADKAAALISSTGFDEQMNGYHGTSDGLTNLRRTAAEIPKHTARSLPYDPHVRQQRNAASGMRAADGNVVQVARVKTDALDTSGGREYNFTLALGFGREADEALRNARLSLAKGWQKTEGEYQQGWIDYVRTLRKVDEKYQRQFDMAAMVLKAHEDKTYRGAMIASLSVPWGGGASANEPNVGGYHLVWSRDLYQVATAFYALGDKASADRALHYLFTVQQKPDGSFPQNSWLDGRPFWGSLQMDEVSYPLILAYQLGRTDNETWTKHVRRAADFIVRHGPRTPQERWEEKPGYSPSTIAAEIAGLVCAAEIARRNDDAASAAIYLAAADDWARNVERWTATTTGTHPERNYYIRITDNDDPNDGALMNAGNGGGDHDERDYVDAGFLELVRLGIKSPADPLIAKSLAVVDRVIKVETPNGATFYRYNYDGYGEMDDGRPWNFDGKYTGKGRLWALLAGERGEYELARGLRAEAFRRLDALLGFANEGLMIPEQVWDRRETPRADLRFGEGTGSATPLAWSMAQFIRLASNLSENRNLFMPDIVAARYAARPQPPARALADFDAPSEEALSRIEAETTFRVAGRVAPRSRVYASDASGTREIQVNPEGRYAFEVRAPRGESHVVVAVHAPNGATRFERLRARGLTAEEQRMERSARLTTPLAERLKAARTSPLIEGRTATFIYRGAARRVELAGDFTSWSPRGLVLEELPGTNLKFYSMTFPVDARAEYKLVADGEWTLDPLNPNSLDNGVGGRNSFFEMPAYRRETLSDARAADPATSPLYAPSKLETLEVESRLLGGARKIQVYLPPQARGSQQSPALPVLYLQDGTDYARRARAAHIAETLITERRVAPFIIVFVDPADRMKEYWANDAFADFMARELVPFVDARFRTRREREGRALLGASLGGVISVWTALRHPEVFARVGGQSSAFQIDDERVVSALASVRPTHERPFRFYFDVGRMEPILEVNRRVQVMLAGRGFPVTYREGETGHNWTSWRDRLADAFKALWTD
jgi:glucoamylase